MNSQRTALIPAAWIEQKILLVRGEKVMLDSDLAELYAVETKALNQAVKRNRERFPADFMFQLSTEEARLIVRSQFVTSAGQNSAMPKEIRKDMGSQFVTTSASRRRISHRPYAFTEQGVAMLSSVLRSDRAVQVNIVIMRIFVQLRQMLESHAGLARRLETLERKYDGQFKVVFLAIRELMNEKKQPRREAGFHTLMSKPAKTAGAIARRISP
jgi:hypothetical protein